jgi:probable HAF family extracellular repeat protein
MKTIVRTAPLLGIAGVIAACSAPASSPEITSSQSQPLTRGQSSGHGKKLLAWGVEGAGAVGDGLATGIRTSPVEIGVAEGVPQPQQLAAGWNYSLLLGVDGSVWAWGTNEHGQLGDGTFMERDVPTPVPGINDAVYIAAGYHNSAIIRSDGSVWVWGENFYGVLGLGFRDGNDYPGPTQKIPNLTGVKKIVIVGFGIEALKNDGTLWAWGYNSLGDLGDAIPSEDLVTSPTQTLTAFGPIADLAGSIAYSHQVLLRPDGTVWTLGSNVEGQLGNGSMDTLPHPTPFQLAAFDGVTTGGVQVATGLYHQLILDTTGHVWSWGNPFYGTGLPQPVLVPTQIPGLDAVSSITAGEYHSFAIRQGKLYEFGFDQVQNSMTPTEMPGVSNVKLISAVAQDLAWADDTALCPTGTTYTVTDLAPLPGDFETQVFAVNELGIAVGISEGFGGLHAVEWADGVPIPLGTLPGNPELWPLSINDLGEAVGFSEAVGEIFQAVSFQGGAVTSLPTLPGASDPQLFSVNNLGVAVGAADLADGVHAVEFSGSAMLDLGRGPLGGGARAFDVNTAGQVIGVSWNSSAAQATRFAPGAPTSLGGLAGYPFCAADGENQNGDAVGQCENAAQTSTQAVIFQQGAAIPLGMLPGDTSSGASTINARGQAVGYSSNSTTSHAVLFENGNVVDLTTRLAPGSTWSFAVALRINDQGQIVGNGSPTGGPCRGAPLFGCGPIPHGFLLTPTCPLR